MNQPAHIFLSIWPAQASVPAKNLLPSFFPLPTKTSNVFLKLWKSQGIKKKNLQSGSTQIISLQGSEPLGAGLGKGHSPSLCPGKVLMHPSSIGRVTLGERVAGQQRGSRASGLQPRGATALPRASVREPRANLSADCLGTTGVGEPLEVACTAQS